MGNVSIEKSNHLYWLGRYSERVFTTISLFMDAYDIMLDDADGAEGYKYFCERLDIPNIYKDREDFNVRYLFDEDDPNSIYSNLRRACDNASVLRDIISSAALSYVQLAVNEMDDAKKEPLCLLRLQQVLDDLYAFWGCIDDKTTSSVCRNIMKFGRYIERLALYIRLDYDKDALSLAYDRMLYRLHRSGIEYNGENLAAFSNTMNKKGDLFAALPNLNNIFKE